MAQFCTQSPFPVKLSNHHYLFQRCPCGHLPRRLSSISCAILRTKQPLVLRLPPPPAGTAANSPQFPFVLSLRSSSSSSSSMDASKGAFMALPDSDRELDPEHGDGGDGKDGKDGGSGGGGGGNPGDGEGDAFLSGDGKDRNSSGSFFSWYLTMLSNYPVRTKAITSALLTLLGDLFCQLGIEKSQSVDIKRIAIFTFLGLALVGPTLHYWYLSLSKLVTGPGVTKTTFRLILDQFVFSPIFIGIFFTSLLVLEGHASNVVPKLKQDWPSAVVANWKIWIPFQFLNFLFVPQQLQVLAANVIALAWNTYLSFATHTDVVAPAHKDGFGN